MKISNKERFEKFIDKNNKCWHFTGTKDTSGYGSFYYKGKMIGAHIFSFKIFVGEIIEGMYILHKCDNPACVNPDHLYQGTAKDNAQDREKRNRGNHASGNSHVSYIHPEKLARGENHGNAKLNEDAVKFIRNKYSFRSKNHNSTILAKKFGVDTSIILDIAHNNTWKG